MLTEKELLEIIEETLKRQKEDDELKKMEIVDHPQPAVKDIDGKAWVKDGKIHVLNPSGSGKMAVIIPVEETTLMINGNIKKEPTMVKEGDQIEVIIEEEEIPGKIKVKISDDGLTAQLEFKPYTITEYKLRDQGPQQELTLDTFAQKKQKNTFSYEQIIGQLVKENVIYGLKTEVIQNLLLHPQECTIIVAEGDPPGESSPDQVELLFPEKLDLKPVLNSNDKVDFRNLKNVFSVEPGTVIAVKHPGIPGKPGKSVTGKIIPPAPPKEILLKDGSGVEIVENRVIANCFGQPSVKKMGSTWIFKVDEILFHPGNVDLSSGNLRFKGSIRIKGDVCEGMLVQATEAIYIGGMVAEAKLSAIGEIEIFHNVIKSHIRAGSSPSYFKDFIPILNELKVIIEKLKETMVYLWSHQEIQQVKVRFNHLLLLVIEKKFPRLFLLIKKLLKSINSASFEIPKEIDPLTQKLSNFIENVQNPKNLQTILEDLDFIINYFESLNENKSDVTLRYTINSFIEATGDITIWGQGCFNTYLKAGGNIKINGVFRGGKAIAKKDIILNEAGSEYAIKTIIVTGGEGSIKIKKAYEGVILQIGRQIREIQGPLSSINARLNKNGLLEVI